MEVTSSGSGCPSSRTPEHSIAAKQELRRRLALAAAASSSTSEKAGPTAPRLINNMNHPAIASTRTGCWPAFISAEYGSSSSPPSASLSSSPSLVTCHKRSSHDAIPSSEPDDDDVTRHQKRSRRLDVPENGGPQLAFAPADMLLPLRSTLNTVPAWPASQGGTAAPLTTTNITGSGEQGSLWALLSNITGAQLAGPLSASNRPDSVTPLTTSFFLRAVSDRIFGVQQAIKSMPIDGCLRRGAVLTQVMASAAEKQPCIPFPPTTSLCATKPISPQPSSPPSVDSARCFSSSSGASMSPSQHSTPLARVQQNTVEVWRASSKLQPILDELTEPLTARLRSKLADLLPPAHVPLSSNVPRPPAPPKPAASNSPPPSTAHRFTSADPWLERRLLLYAAEQEEGEQDS